MAGIAEPYFMQPNGDILPVFLVPDELYLNSEVIRLATEIERCHLQLLVSLTSIVNSAPVQFNSWVSNGVANVSCSSETNYAQNYICTTTQVDRTQQSSTIASTNGISRLSEEITGVVRNTASLVIRFMAVLMRAYDKELGKMWGPE